MKDNRYTRAMNTVEISGEALDNGLKYAREHSADEKGDKVINMKNKQNNLWKAAAACLAAAVGIGGAVYGGAVGNSSGKGDALMFTANAQEWTYGACVDFGELLPAGGGFRAEPAGEPLSGDLIGAEHFYVGAESYTALPIRCEGENIESVTYTLKNDRHEAVEACFILGEHFIGQTENDSSEQEYNWYSPSETYASEYTVAFDDQPYYGENGMALDAQGRQSAEEPEPVILAVHYRINPEKLGLNDWRQVEEIKRQDGVPKEWYDVMEDMYRSEDEKLKIEVTVGFNDGTEQTETIDLDITSGSIEYENGPYYCTKVSGTLNEHE